MHHVYVRDPYLLKNVENNVSGCLAFLTALNLGQTIYPHRDLHRSPSVWNNWRLGDSCSRRELDTIGLIAGPGGGSRYENGGSLPLVCMS